jgi:hypothetical protein
LYLFLGSFLQKDKKSSYSDSKLKELNTSENFHLNVKNKFSDESKRKIHSENQSSLSDNLIVDSSSKNNTCNENCSIY